MGWEDVYLHTYCVTYIYLYINIDPIGTRRLQRKIYELLVVAQLQLFGKKLFFDWKWGDSMETLDKELQDDNGSRVSQKDEYVYVRQIVLFNAIGFLVLHLGALYGLYLALTATSVLTMIWGELYIRNYDRVEIVFDS